MRGARPLQETLEEDCEEMQTQHDIDMDVLKTQMQVSGSQATTSAQVMIMHRAG